MAEASVGRALRDGSLDGEHAVALCIRDSLSCPLGAQVFGHCLRGLAANVAAGRSSARGLVLVALDQSPRFYLGLLNAGSRANWLRVLDCYSDPLGWKARSGCDGPSVDELRAICTDVKDVDRLLSLVLDLGRGIAEEGTSRFAVAIDSISTLLRRASLASVAKLISNLRSHGQVSSILWLIKSDLHEPRVCAAIDYLSTMVAILEPGRENPGFLGGQFHLRMKRRNGRVKVIHEEFTADAGGMKLLAPLTESKSAKQTLLPKLQFNLQLSEKERMDKERVVLPFEHQGNGEPMEIYDGRRSARDSEKDDAGSGNGKKGEIHYVRDSDDELPDSDEDPDDDLDI